MKRVVHAACPHDCPDACAVLITVREEDGRAVKIQGDPAHPVTRGFLCAKVAKYLDRVYSPERVLYPMRRVGPKAPNRDASLDALGSSAAADSRAGDSPRSFARQKQNRLAQDDKSTWERISWDEALDEIATRLKKISNEFGPEAILPYSYGGTLGALGNASMDRRFFHRLGASQLDRTICATTGGEALISVVGKKYGTEPEQFRHARTIVAWGANIHGTNVHLWPFIEEARRNGGKLIVIDPYRTRTAKCADWYLPIVPGTDVALAMGLMHVIISENLYDADYVARFTEGFDELRERVCSYTPERVARWTGIAASDIEKLARQYATQRPAVIRVNYGVQRSENGGMAMRAISMLPCITGSWKEVGGGLQLSLSGAFGLNDAALGMPELMQKSPLGRAARVVNMSQLGSALNTLDDPPVKALFVYNSNPAAVAPNHNSVIRGLQRADLFTVVHEQFFTDTCDYADIVLPATTFFEHKDLQKSYGHYYLQISQQALEPLGEARSNVELFRALAHRMGFDEPCFDDSVDAMIDAALRSPNPWLQGIDRERLEAEHWVKLNVPQAKNNFLPFAQGFPTPSGKARLHNDALGALGVDPVIEFRVPQESRHGDAAQKFPLELLGRKADNFLNTTFCNIPAVRELEQRDLLEISSADAEARGITEGDRVRVWNDRGSLELTAHVNGAVQPGVVAARLDWARGRGGNVNNLTSERLTDFGGGPTFYSCLVEVARL